MGTRQKIKEEERRIRELINEKSVQESAATRAWNKMMEYFSMSDFLDGSNHVEIIAHLYCAKKFIKETMYCISWKNYIGERTLYRYRKKYILCFKRYYEQERGDEQEYFFGTVISAR